MANRLKLNIEKTHIMRFNTRSQYTEVLQLGSQNTLINGVNATKFWGIELDANINWKNHVIKLISRLGSACCSIRKLHASCSIDTLKLVHYAYFHSVMEYGVMLWGNSTDSKRIFLLQKRIIRIMMGSAPRASYEDCLRNWEYSLSPRSTFCP